MKTVFLTQRVQIVQAYNERRDCLDQAWHRFVLQCGFLPVAVPNNAAAAKELFDALPPAGIVFTGGNSLAAYGGEAPERDETEKILLMAALDRKIPVLGVCRGMQFLQDYYGGILEKPEGHTGTRHRLIFGGQETEVNSYHDFSIKAIPDGFQVLAASGDGVIEAMRHETEKIMGIMWHPERETDFSKRDLELFINFIGGE